MSVPYPILEYKSDTVNRIMSGLSEIVKEHGARKIQGAMMFGYFSALDDLWINRYACDGDNNIINKNVLTITDVLDFEYHYKTILYSDMNRNPKSLEGWFNSDPNLGVAPITIINDKTSIIHSCGNFFRDKLSNIIYE